MQISASRPPGRRPTQGFTLIEIMVVVVIIGLLAALAFPMYQYVRRTSRQAAFVNDLRMARDTIFQYAFNNGTYPPDGSSGFPTELDTYLPPTRWSRPTPIGGHWDWDLGVYGVTAAVSVLDPEQTDEQMAEIDARIDDGNINTGAFRKRSGGFMWIMQY